MEVRKTEIDGLLIMSPKLFRDARGYFLESYREEIFRDRGIEVSFVQDNESNSEKHVLRGLHFQNPPYAQGKLVRVVKGAVLDVVVDIRSNSATYGEHFSIELNEENKTMLWIPAGFAHGFVTLDNDTIFQYKCTNYYNRDSEGSIRWNDPDLKINWMISAPKVSEKDSNAPFFKDLKSNF